MRYITLTRRNHSSAVIDADKIVSIKPDGKIIYKSDAMPEIPVLESELEIKQKIAELDLAVEKKSKPGRRNRKKNVLPPEEAMNQLKERIQLCANIYGVNYKEHELLFRSLEAYIKDLEEKLEWIGITEDAGSLPEPEEIVELTVRSADDGPSVRLGFFCEADDDFIFDGADEDDYEVIAWKPAPDPFEEEAADDAE